MTSLQDFIDRQLAKGRECFTRPEAMAAGFSPRALSAAVTRLIGKGKVANPRHGFYLILRPEDRAAGAPDPARWIDPLMRHQGLDYRISLLRAAAFHGSSHQSAMVFQVIVPRQLRDFTIGRYRLQFLYQSSAGFAASNHAAQLDRLKTPAGYAQMAGVELTLLDCARYPHRSGGVDAVAQIAQDIGAKADPGKLARAASAYEGSTVRRLGYLLDRSGHAPQADALEPAARKAKTAVALDSAFRPLVEGLIEPPAKNARWKLVIHQPVEVDF